MHILLTGASGHIGSHTLVVLLEWTKVQKITAVDVVPLPVHITLGDRAEFKIVDLANINAVGALFAQMPRCDAVIHLGGIPNPETYDHRLVHNINVTSTYNVLYTATKLGVKRIVQASSVNAMGLSYTAPEHRWFNAVPFDEETPCKPEDAYALSKYQYVQGNSVGLDAHGKVPLTPVHVSTNSITEVQASAITRLLPDVRIASLRFHMVRPTYQTAWPDAEVKDLFGWVSYASAAQACLLGLTSEGWEGHEVFNIVADKICWEGGLKLEEKKRLPEGTTNDVRGWGGLTPSCGLEEQIEGEKKVSSLDLLKHHWPGTPVKPGWWETENDRRGFWDTSKAERFLGWRHEG